MSERPSSSRSSPCPRTSIRARPTGRSRVYRRADRPRGATTVVLVSRRTGANGAVAEGHEPSISDDGNRIAFTNDSAPGASTTTDTNDASPTSTSATWPRARRCWPAARTAHGAVRQRALVLSRPSPATARPSPSSPRRTSSTTPTDPDTQPGHLPAFAGPRRPRRWSSINAGGHKATVLDAAVDRRRPATSSAFLVARRQLDPDDTDSDAGRLRQERRHQHARAGQPRRRQPAAPVANADAAASPSAATATRSRIGAASGADRPRADPRQPRGDPARPRGVNLDRLLRPARQAPAPFLNEGGSARSAAALSADGRYAAFVSDARGLGLPDGAARGRRSSATVSPARVTLASRHDGAGRRADACRRRRRATSAPTAAASPSSPGRRPGPDQASASATLPTGRTFLASRADGARGRAGERHVVRAGARRRRLACRLRLRRDEPRRRRHRQQTRRPRPRPRSRPHDPRQPRDPDGARRATARASAPTSTPTATRVAVRLRTRPTSATATPTTRPTSTCAI